jgi:type II restriction enzyme
MDIQCDVSVGAGYKSSSQLARRITEHWCARELYCAACMNNHLRPAATNTPSTDFICPQCAARYQVKSSTQPPRTRIVDAAYSAMIRAIRDNATPHLVCLHYTNEWAIANVLLVPSFFLTESTIECRRPLALTARRAGWVGCNILLHEVPPAGKISVVTDGRPVSATIVRSKFVAVSGLRKFAPGRRGWVVDVLRIIERFRSADFHLADVYEHDDELSALHPGNQNVRPKIRQQLQVLRDLGFIEFLGGGIYRRRDTVRTYESDCH